MAADSLRDGCRIRRADGVSAPDVRRGDGEFQPDALGVDHDRWVFEAHGKHRGLGVGIDLPDVRHRREEDPRAILGDGAGRVLRRRRDSLRKSHVAHGDSNRDRAAGSLERPSRRVSTSEVHHARRAHPGFSWNVGIAVGGAIQSSSEAFVRHGVRVGEGAGRSEFQYKLRPSFVLVA